MYWRCICDILWMHLRRLIQLLKDPLQSKHVLTFKVLNCQQTWKAGTSICCVFFSFVFVYNISTIIHFTAYFWTPTLLPVLLAIDDLLTYNGPGYTENRVVGITLDHGCSTHGPWATCGLQIHLMWPMTSHQGSACPRFGIACRQPQLESIRLSTHHPRASECMEPCQQQRKQVDVEGAGAT